MRAPPRAAPISATSTLCSPPGRRPATAAAPSSLWAPASPAPLSSLLSFPRSSKALPKASRAKAERGAGGEPPECALLHMRTASRTATKLCRAQQLLEGLQKKRPPFGGRSSDRLDGSLLELHADTAVELATRHAVERGQEAVREGRQCGRRFLIKEVPDTEGEIGVPVVIVISALHIVIDRGTKVVLGQREVRRVLLTLDRSRAEVRHEGRTGVRAETELLARQGATFVHAMDVLHVPAGRPVAIVPVQAGIGTLFREAAEARGGTGELRGDEDRIAQIRGRVRRAAGVAGHDGFALLGLGQRRDRCRQGIAGRAARLRLVLHIRKGAGARLGLRVALQERPVQTQLEVADRGGRE